MNKQIKIITMQAIFLAVVLIALYLLYPKTSVNVEGDVINVNSINAEVIIISENPDFSNPKFIGLEKNKNVSFNLGPGTYYWKASNNFIEGLKNEFIIESEVGMEIERKENESELVNVGNVKINVTKSEEGVFIGHIILEPNETEKIEDEAEEKYVGRQE